MKPKLDSLYLELMKKTLTFTMWKEPGVPIEIMNYRRALPRRWLMSLLSAIFRVFNLQIVKMIRATEEERLKGRIWPVYAESMIGVRRMDNIQYCVEKVLEDKVDGDLIETGVWRGGGCIFMRAILAAHGSTDRRVFVADSFEGLPKPDAEKYPEDKHDRHYTMQFLEVSQEQVAANFAKYGLLDDQVVFLKGWFKDTLPKAPIQKLAVMRLDGDMYESTMDALTSLYHKLSPGGFCIIDDYNRLNNCKAAVDDFRTKLGIKDPIIKIDDDGVFWKKA